MIRLVDALVPGARVFVPTMAGESALLGEELCADPDRAADVTFVGVQFPGIDRIDYVGIHPKARQLAFFMSPALRRGLAEGRAELLSADYLGIARHLADGPAPDVVIAQLTPPDAAGWCSAGASSDFMPLVWSRAGQRVAHLNPRLPRTRGSFRVHMNELDFAVERDADLIDYREPAVGDVESRIARHAATLVRDGDTLQLGIGAVPMALAGALGAHRRLRLHGGIVSASMERLWNAGVLDRDARITAGVILGDAALRDFAARLETLWLTDVTRTHGLDGIRASAQGSRFVAINGALEVDLFGQVNAERVGGRIQAGAGGLPAFAHAAQALPQARIVTCVGATTKTGASRVVAELGAGSLCSLPRHLVDAVVTEHGVAELGGLGLEARALALIAIAAPSHRDALAGAWQSLRAAC